MRHKPQKAARGGSTMCSHSCQIPLRAVSPMPLNNISKGTSKEPKWDGEEPPWEVYNHCCPSRELLSSPTLTPAVQKGKDVISWIQGACEPGLRARDACCWGYEVKWLGTA